MVSIRVEMKDGTVLTFPHQGRAGSSYTKTVKEEGAFLVITDEWGKQTLIPAQDIRKAEVEPVRW